jgi:hypothetical protein
LGDNKKKNLTPKTKKNKNQILEKYKNTKSFFFGWLALSTTKARRIFCLDSL